MLHVTDRLVVNRGHFRSLQLLDVLGLSAFRAGDVGAMDGPVPPLIVSLSSFAVRRNSGL
jgi:hypothetical protein